MRKTLLLWLSFLACVSFGASAQNVVTISPASPVLDTSPDVYRSTTKIGSNAPTLQACIDAIKANAETRAPGTYAYSCRPGITAITATVTAAPACPPAPANETRPQTCPAGTTGTWTQVRTYNSAPQPTCWVAGEWLPLTAPAGACVTPPPIGTITIGTTSILTGVNSGDAGLLVAQKVSLAQPAALQSLSFYIGAASGQLRLGFYDATGPSGQPGQKVAETATFTPVSGWNTQPVASSVLAAGSYWIAYAPSANALTFRSVWGVGNYCSMPLTFGAMPQTFATVASCGATEWSMYATLVPGVVAPPPPCPAKPADETRTQACPAGTTGSWTQTRSYASAPSPTCWTAGAWTPASAPAGACAVIVGTGTATLTWDQPTDPQVTGWRVYWGTAPRTYAQALGTGALVTGSQTYVVSALPSGTHYFAVTAVAADGRESAYSNEASKAIP